MYTNYNETQLALTHRNVDIDLICICHMDVILHIYPYVITFCWDNSPLTEVWWCLINVKTGEYRGKNPVLFIEMVILLSYLFFFSIVLSFTWILSPLLYLNPEVNSRRCTASFMCSYTMFISFCVLRVVSFIYCYYCHVLECMSISICEHFNRVEVLNWYNIAITLFKADLGLYSVYMYISMVKCLPETVNVYCVWSYTYNNSQVQNWYRNASHLIYLFYLENDRT